MRSAAGSGMVRTPDAEPSREMGRVRSMLDLYLTEMRTAIAVRLMLLYSIGGRVSISRQPFFCVPEPWPRQRSYCAPNNP